MQKQRSVWYLVTFDVVVVVLSHFVVQFLNIFKTTLYTMIKVCIFNKSNDVSRFDIFKKFSECINFKISLM